MSASWDSDLSSIIEKTNNNLKLLRKIGDKPHVRAPDVSMSTASYSSARPRAFLGAQDHVGSASSRGSARPRAFLRNDDDTSSMGSHGSIRPKAYVREHDGAGSVTSHSALPKAFIRPDDDVGSTSSRVSVRPKAFIRTDDDAGSASSRASARPMAFIRPDNDSGSVASRRPKAFVRGDDDTGSMSSLASARPKAFVRGDEDSGSLSSNPGLGRSRIDSGNTVNRPHVGIAGGGGLTAAMLQQHRAAGSLALTDSSGPRSRFDLDETRSTSGVSVSRPRRSQCPTTRVLHAQPHEGSRIRVPDADIPSEKPNHVVDELRKSSEIHFSARMTAVDKTVANLLADVAGLTMQTSALSSQMADLRDAVLVSSTGVSSARAESISASPLQLSVETNGAAITRLEEHSADLMGHKVSIDRELTDLGARVQALSSTTVKITSLDDSIEALCVKSQHQEQGLLKLDDRVQVMHRQMGNFVDMKAVEQFVSSRLTHELRDLEDRLVQDMKRMAEKMEQKVQHLDNQLCSQRQESLATLKRDFTDELQRLQSSALCKSDLVPLQNAQTRSNEELAQLLNTLNRQEKKLQDAKVANSTLRDELGDARSELKQALQSHQHSATALMEKTLESMTSKNKMKALKLDDQLALLVKKQKKLEDATDSLTTTIDQMNTEAGQRLRSSSAQRDEENDKLRQRLARAVAELEALSLTKTEVERRCAREEQRFQTRLEELRLNVLEAEKQKEVQRLDLMQKLQEESKLLGVAQGKNTLLERLLTREQARHDAKKEVVLKSKMEVAEVREQIRLLQRDKETMVCHLKTELQAKQMQIGRLTTTLNRVETSSTTMVDRSQREAKSVRRAKATKEHELFLAQLKLKEMERVALARLNGDEMTAQAAVAATSTQKCDELEKLLLASQLEKNELKQELREMVDELEAAQESQKVIMEDTIAKLASDYDSKIDELQQQITDKEQAVRRLRDTLVDKSNLNALADELAALEVERNNLVEHLQQTQIEHERGTLKIEADLGRDHASEFVALKTKFKEHVLELQRLQSILRENKATIAVLEEELRKQEALHQHEVVNLATEIKGARKTIDECTARNLLLEETKTRLESEILQMEAKQGGAAVEIQMQSEVDNLRAELASILSNLTINQTQLNEAKRSDETNRQRLVEMAMAQEDMQSRYVSQIDSLTLKLSQEREISCAREQELEDTINALNADVKTLQLESSQELESARSGLMDQMTELTTTLKASQHREQQLQSRLERMLQEFVQATNALGVCEAASDTEMSGDRITHNLNALNATHRRTVHELEHLRVEYELTIKQAAADSLAALALDNQVKEHQSQITKLEAVVEQLREVLKEQFHKSALLAKGSDDFRDEMALLRTKQCQLERQLQDEAIDHTARQVAFKRKTDVTEHELQQLRDENKTLTAAVATVRQKILAVENLKYHELCELETKLKELEERTAALQLDESNVGKLEKDFATTRQDIVTLTATVQSLYQTLTACCGVLEWSDLRASVYDEEEKITRVRLEHAGELAKVQSVEEEVLMNAQFLNALLVAHGSTIDDENEFRWMLKYTVIAPSIVKKLRKVEARLRNVVLDQHDSTSLFSMSSEASLGNGDPADEDAARSSASHTAAVDHLAMALALEKASEDYSETLIGEELKLEPDGEQESIVDHDEGASQSHVDLDGQDSIGDYRHGEPGLDVADELEVAEDVVRVEQETRYETHDSTTAAMANVEDRRVATGRCKRPEDALDVAEWESSKDGAKMPSTMDLRCRNHVEKGVLERSRNQVKQCNECDACDESRTSNVHESQSSAAVLLRKGREFTISINSHEASSDPIESYEVHAQQSSFIAVVVPDTPELPGGDPVSSLSRQLVSTMDERKVRNHVRLFSSSVGNAQADHVDESNILQETMSSRTQLSAVGVSTNCDSPAADAALCIDHTMEKGRIAGAETRVLAKSAPQAASDAIDTCDLLQKPQDMELDGSVDGVRIHRSNEGKDSTTSIPSSDSMAEQGFKGLDQNEASLSLARWNNYDKQSLGRENRRHDFLDLQAEDTDDDDNHADCGTGGTFEPDAPDGSFDADSIPDPGDDDACQNSRAELPSELIDIQEQDGHEWQQQAAASLINVELVPEDEGKAGGSMDGSMDDTVSVMPRRLGADKSVAKENSMSVQAQFPSFSSRLTRFAPQTRCLNLTKDEEEVDRLLSVQSVASMQSHHQPRRFISPGAENDGDELGESSLQPQSEDTGDAFRDNSTEPRAYHAVHTVSTMCGDNFADVVIHHEASSPSKGKSTLVDQLGHDFALNDASITTALVKDFPTRFDGVQTKYRRDNDGLEGSIVSVDQDLVAESDEGDQSALSAASTTNVDQSDEVYASKDSCVSMEKADYDQLATNCSLLQASATIGLDTEASLEHDILANALDDGVVSEPLRPLANEGGNGSAVDESLSNIPSVPRDEGDTIHHRHRFDELLAQESDNDHMVADRRAEASIRLNQVKNSFDAAMQSGHDDDAKKSWSAEGRVQAYFPSFSASRSRFGVGTRRPNLEKDSGMDEIERLLLDHSASTMPQKDLRPSRVASSGGREDIDDEWDESSLQSRGHDDECGDKYIQGNEARDSSTQSRKDAWNDATKLHSALDFGEGLSQESNAIKKRSVKALERTNNVGNPEESRGLFLSNPHSEQDEARGRLRDTDELGETCTRKEEEIVSFVGLPHDGDLSEYSLLLEENDNRVASPRGLYAPKIRPFARPQALTANATIYHDGLIASPPKRTNSSLGQDSFSEEEQDYAENSFDLEESLEMEEMKDDSEKRKD